MPQTTVALRVPESKKEEWEQIVSESPEYDSVSHLIRLAVQKEITGESDRRESATNDDTGDTSEVLSELQRLQGGFERIEREIDALKREQEPQYDLDKILLEVLPEQPDGTRDDAMSDSGPEPGDVGMPPQEVADRIGGDLDEISGALGRLVKNLKSVQSVTDRETNVPYYWVIEQ